MRVGTEDSLSGINTAKASSLHLTSPSETAVLSIQGELVVLVVWVTGAKGVRGMGRGRGGGVLGEIVAKS